MQKALMVQDPLRITQGENGSTSHNGSYALDLGGKNTAGAGSVDFAVAPWDGKVVRADGSSNNAMYIESTSAVLAPNGTVAVQRFVFIHTNAYLFKAGQTFKQGQKLYVEGTRGGVQAHIHIEGGFGTWDSVGGAKLAKNAYGTYTIAKQAHIYDMLFVPDNYTISASGGYKWVRASAAPATGGNTNTNTNTQGDDDVNIGLYRADKGIVERSSVLLDGDKVIRIDSEGANAFGTVLKRVLKREVTEATLSSQYEDIKYNQAKKGDVIIVTEA